jgi:hypothetical protein
MVMRVKAAKTVQATAIQMVMGVAIVAVLWPAVTPALATMAREMH